MLRVFAKHLFRWNLARVIIVIVFPISHVDFGNGAVMGVSNRSIRSRHTNPGTRSCSISQKDEQTDFQFKFEIR